MDKKEEVDVVYKYMPAEDYRLETFLEGFMWFSYPEHLSDTGEYRIEQLETGIDNITPEFERRIVDHIATKHPERKIYEDPIVYDKIRRNEETKRILRESFLPPFIEGKQMPVLSMSLDWKLAYMWDRFTAGSSGVGWSGLCIELDQRMRSPSKGIFIVDVWGKSPIPRQMNYTSAPPTLEYLYERCVMQEDEEALEVFLRTKNDQYANEREIRFFARHPDKSGRIPGLERNFSIDRGKGVTIPFYNVCASKVFFGYRCSHEFRTRWIQRIRAKFPSIEFFQCGPGIGSWDATTAERIGQ